MNAEQRERFLRYRGNGAKLLDAARMVGMPLPDFRAQRSKGRADHEAGRESEEASLYVAATSAFAKHVSVKRAQAAAAAGSRESADLLNYVRELEAEDPLLDDEPTGRGADLVASDLLAGDTLTEDERAKLAAEHEAFTRAGLALFGTILEVQDRQRVGAVSGAVN